LRTWLGSPLPNDIYDDSRNKRLDGTCEWILQREKFLEWQAPSSSSKVLWIRGPAGFGKTILCGRIVEEVEITSTGPVASFFLSSKFEGRDNPFSVIRSWLMTLMMRSKAAFGIMRATRVSQHEQKATQAQTLALFGTLLTEIPGCTLILDGLDECASVIDTDVESIPRFLDVLREVVSQTNTRLLITSRGNRVIQQGLCLFPGYSDYDITTEDVATDLMAYSSQVVSTRLSNKDESTRLLIANKMKDRCEGQFQWIKLQEKSLRKGRNRKQLEREIDNTPSGLDSLYDREWKRINSMGVTDKERALCLLRWIVFATRPLNVFEISEAVLVMDGCEELPVDEMPDEFDDDYVESMILNLCGSLLETRHPSKNGVQTIRATHDDYTKDESQFDVDQSSVGWQEVHLTHFSVKEYLLSINLFPIPSPISNENLRVSNEQLGNTALAKACLRYINFKGAWEDWQAERPATGLLSYAAESWPIHYKRVQAPDVELRGAINDLFEGRSKNFEAWRDWHDFKLFDLPSKGTRKVNPFHIAISLGLEDVVADQIRKSKQVLNIRSDGNAAALHFLCFSQSKSLAELLIDNGAELNPVVGDGVTPLSLALAWGNIEIAEILLARGASVTLADKYGKTPLHIVAEQGNVNLARQILDRGCDLSAKAKDGYTPLLYAARDGHCEVLKLLLERGASYLDSVKGHTAIGLAAWYNNVSVVRVLLDQGQDVEATGNGISLLGIAAFRGHVELAELILDRGAAIDRLCYGRSGHTPLRLAISRGNHAVAKVLLSRGADITTVSKALENPLYEAAANGRRDVVELLLRDNADGGEDGYAALKFAIQVNHLEAVETLFHATRSIIKNSYTPLHIAAGKGRWKVIEVLLNAGADAMAKDSTGRTPLSYAAEYGRTSAVDLLWGKNYSYLTCFDNCHRMPMHYACITGYVDVVSLILSRLPKSKSIIDARDHWGSTPLSLAARQGHTEIVEILLATKLVDTNSRDDLRRTVEWWATQQGHSEILTLITGTEGKQAHEKRKDEGYGRLSCDICCLTVFDESFYHCGICNAGDFDICVECFGRGGRCLDGMHRLTLSKYRSK
jgi:ankyrin repeat protein